MTGGAAPVRLRTVVVGVHVPLPPLAGGEFTVPEVAAAVDAGRGAARDAADEGVGLIGGEVAVAPAADRLAAWLAGLDADPEIRGPLGALRRLGSPELGVLAGIALGAGERGLGCVCSGLAATAGAAVAAALEPDLRARLLAVGEEPEGPLHGALLSHLGLSLVSAEALQAAIA